MRIQSISLFAASIMLMLSSCKKDIVPSAGMLQIIKVTVGTESLNNSGITVDIPVDQSLSIWFSGAVNLQSATKEIYLESENGGSVELTTTFSDADHQVILTPAIPLLNSSGYKLVVTNKLSGASSETFRGIEYLFSTVPGELKINRISLNGNAITSAETPINIDWQSIEIAVEFSEPLDPDHYLPFFLLSGGITILPDLSADSLTVTLRNQSDLKGYSKYFFIISSNLTAAGGNRFNGYSSAFFTALDSTYKYPEISDDELLDKIQSQTFKYFWDFGHPDCGLARERNSSGDVVTIGGSGFGVMALIAGIERGFISRSDGLNRLAQMLGFLETCDRFHGVWPHWLNGKTGKVVPFSQQDDGGDLVETAFMMQGLLTFRQYLDPQLSGENELIERIDSLWHQVEWSWYTNNQQVLYWHWSPNHHFNMNHQIRGHNETLITYVLAASSPTFPIGAEAYHQGYASNGGIINGKTYYGITLPLGWDYGGPLFFTHYSFLGLDPRNLSDRYANYWTQNVNHSLINRAWCIANPKKFVGYSADCWGLTASDNSTGYSAHSPTNDRGVITPTAAISSIPYTPEESMEAIRHFYYLLGDKLWGPYGFYDAFEISKGWWATSYLAIDQGPEIVMIENYRTALLWNLFMTAPEIRDGLSKLGFTY